MSDLHWLGTVLILMSAGLSTSCVAAHALLARWWETHAGRHAFTFQAVLAAVLDLWALRLVIPDTGWFVLARVLAFVGVPVVIAWRLVIIVRVWHSARTQRRG